MTRRICYILMQTTGNVPFYEAVRYTQVKALGGDPSLAHALAGTSLGRGFMDDEEFWLTVIRWFCRQEGIFPRQVGPRIDYVAHISAHIPSYSMKGRTVRSLRRAMEDCHRELAKAHRGKGRRYPESGFKEGIWEFKSRKAGGPHGSIMWTMEEILNSMNLALQCRW